MKRAQEEMVGFAMIIIVVAVILLIFLAFTIKDSNKEAVESYEVESFIQSSLQYTTDCRDNLESLSVQKLIDSCNANRKCLDERNTCDVLNQTLNGIVKESWKIGENRPIKGYEFKILENEEEMLKFVGGNITVNSKSSIQYLKDTEVLFTAHY